MTGSRAAPRFSIVTAVYNVELYLRAFIDSVDRQRFDLSRLEVVAVDDGSTDGSLDVLIDWAKRSRARVKVFTKPNGGQGSARNLGLDHATGEWVTFADPDDILDPGYLRAADRFATTHPDVEVMSARPILYFESTGRRSLAHPRRWQYARGNRTANLLEEPNVFLGLTPASFFRLERIQAHGLRFDTRIRPNFEDAQFGVRYVLELDPPIVGLVRDAQYVYRKRAAGTSTLQMSMADPGRYSSVLEFGYLDVLERGRRPDGSIVEWIQQMIVYELTWYLSEDEKISSGIRLPPDMAPRFHQWLDEVLRRLEPRVIARHGVRRMTSIWFDLLAHAGRDETWHSAAVIRSRRDRVMRLRRYHYRFVGPAPRETFRVDGEPVKPAFQKTTAHRYFGRDFLWERILWLPDDDRLEIELDGVPMRQHWAWPLPRPARRPGAKPGRRLGDRAWRYRQLLPGRLVPAIAHRVRRALRRATAPLVRRAARARLYARFRDAWVLIDRIHDADDNGERLFEHLRRERPDINAWFVLERGTPDWDRLAATGERRLVAHGSWTWKMLMLNCAWLLSSHIDVPIARPPQLLRILAQPTWRLGFIQHGVTKDDLSRWLNHRELELFTVSTEPELAAVVGDGTAYRWTAKETRLTGLPRFDRLLAKGRAMPREDRNLVIVAPTWRQWLTLPLASGSQRRQLDADFWESDYIRNWTAVLRSEAIASALAKRGWRLGFMPHPNLQGMLGELDLPAHVEPLSFAGVDVQDLYARCALLVTDYSSVAFNTAYIDRPVVYFQFDRDLMLGGVHVGRQGYFDYVRDGFGPVTEDVAATERAIVASIRHGARPAAEYLARIAATFPVRDGGACARVVATVEELSRPYVPSGGGGVPVLEDPARTPAG